MSLRRFQYLSFRSKNDGLTLLESLVAIVVIGISVAVMSPMVILSVATRVQSQQAEQAFQIAQAEVDRIKLIVERGGDYTLNIASTPNTVLSTADFNTAPKGPVPAPKNIAANYSATSDSAKGIDVDNDGNNDYAVQVFKTAGSTTSTGKPVAFDLGIRVYRADVVNPANSLSVEQAYLGLTSGEGQSATRPLATIYTSIIKSDTDRSLCDYYGFLNSVNGTTVSTPSEC
ncbi:prepilin-type N-terminal cleavage/methylation domain-containing protein [Leptothoe sp. PORK10 BA2]|uniref:prepilin-type N-terminal cleavage/methylation domain-containing protein n=1 Tax=Leptothoe sp. PORK10 BA2 TaxID=3110254 RepID=UPI002B1F4D1E|nr:prepilin-type N-terminal cleavage/methylation domain-containing protein [Leptothoe sp. PORK10 BA2]MEA5466009.1 prepilin-type N-terminal cleavage/methylation domain-containing protein [Leptothoe sp. PORK10 BA2]